jgi:hypothetical protein
MEVVVAMMTTLSRLNGTVTTYDWQWQGQPLLITYETLGTGDPVLLLPAFSTVSSRSELTILAQRLATCYQVTVLDWPGFGDVNSGNYGRSDSGNYGR